MISGFLDVSRPFKTNIIIFGHTRTPTKIQEQILEHFWKHIMSNVKLLKIEHFEMLDHIWTRRAPKNGGDPFKQILKILNMGPIFWEYLIPIIYNRIIHYFVING